MKCRSRAPGHCACLKAITMQGLTLTAIIAAEKQTNARTDVKNYDSHWSVKCSSRTKQGLTLAAIIAAEKQTQL